MTTTEAAFIESSMPDFVPMAILATPRVAIAEVVPPTPAAPRAQPSSNAEYRVLIALGAFVMLVGAALYFMSDVLQPSVPDNFLTYICDHSAMTISYLPNAQEIRFATGDSSIKTVVAENRIVWENYQDASAKLGIQPPVNIMAVDARQLVVSGGMFENTTCRATSPHP